ncbi:HipA N-terminal domain-containing protein [Micromonospora sp. DT4]|uniref:HipA N-terminal domain-containing protein n=1 Tax=Micromonospora sp. DT4 TaxID=3393438 RepID=UPI003CF25D71
MVSSDSWFGVWLGDQRVGTLQQVGDRTWFSLDRQYREDPNRPVMGLVFEDRPTAVHAAAVRLPAWFSNLLPEGRLRDWIADERGVNGQREMELLAQVGHDLPGAVRVLPEGEERTCSANVNGMIMPCRDSRRSGQTITERTATAGRSGCRVKIDPPYERITTGQTDSAAHLLTLNSY